MGAPCVTWIGRLLGRLLANAAEPFGGLCKLLVAPGEIPGQLSCLLELLHRLDDRFNLFALHKAPELHVERVHSHCSRLRMRGVVAGLGVRFFFAFFVIFIIYQDIVSLVTFPIDFFKILIL